MQKEIIINDVNVPIIENGGLWYPISYLGNKILLKNLAPSQLRQNGYGKYMKEFKIDYGENTGGILKAYCISEEGLKIILNNSKIGRLSVKQKKAMNGLLQYLGMELILEDERFIKTLPQDKILKYSEYIRDCIQDVLNENSDIIWQRCGKCGNYYPYHANFFLENPNPGKYPLYTYCRDCKWTDNRSKDWIRRNNTRLSNVYRRLGIDTYKLYRDNDIIGIYKDWLKKNYSNSLPNELNSKKNYLIIIKYLYDIKKITKDNLTSNFIKKNFKLNSLGRYLNIYEIYLYLFEDDPINYPWKYPNFQLSHKNLSFEQYKKIFINYLEDNNIIIDDIFNFDYMSICKKCRLAIYVENDILGFVVRYYNYKYPGYKFKISSRNYWKNKENRMFDLQWLIEKDMKIPLEKIPLYLTLENLRKNSNTLRNVARKYYKSNLWIWVNEIYPEKFIEEDFNVTVIRNVFDSADEHVIHDILKSKFNNVIYNQRNTENTIIIGGMLPDWFIVTDNKLWVIEYFGIAPQQVIYNNNKKIKYYKKKMMSKIDKYERMKWLGKVYIYPDDLRDNFKGLEDKLKVIE